MPYSGSMAARTIRSRRATIAGLAVTLCLGVGAPGAVAQGQDLPNPDNGGSAAGNGGNAEGNGGSGGGGGLPQTGLFAVPVLAAGFAFLVAGVATRPARRRRRDYSCDVWWDAVMAPRDDSRPGDGHQ